MDGLVRYATLTAKSKTGLGLDVVTWGIVALICAVVTFVFLLVAAYVALADRYSPLTAALILFVVFLLAAILAGVVCLMSQRRNTESAKRELATRASAAMWLQPKFLAVGVDVLRSIGLRKLVPLAAAGILAGGLAREWFVSHREHAEDNPGA